MNKNMCVKEGGYGKKKRWDEGSREGVVVKGTKRKEGSEKTGCKEKRYRKKIKERNQRKKMQNEEGEKKAMNGMKDERKGGRSRG